MKNIHITSILVSFSFLTSATFAMPNTYKDNVGARAQLKSAIDLAQKNRDKPQVAGEYLHDAFEIAFQLTEYTLAKNLLGASVSEGVELALWDNVALAEIFAREGDYEKAAGRLNFAIDSFKKAKCKFNPKWKKFLSALNKKSQSEIAPFLETGGSPALIHSSPNQGATHKRTDVKFTSLDKTLPKEISVNLVIDAKGNVQCAAMQAEDKKYRKMLLALKKIKFEPAMVNNEPVWQYGKSYTIQHIEGHSMILQQMRNQNTMFRAEIRNQPSLVNTRNR